MRAFIIFCLLLSGMVVNAQSFKGFFKPVDQVVSQNPELLQGVFDDVTFLFRPNVALTAVAISLKEKPVQTRALTSAGFGLSMGKFTIVNGDPYCNYSINASLLTSVKLNNETGTQFGGSLTVDVFNKLLGAGVGYLDGSFLLLTTVSYSV